MNSEERKGQTGLKVIDDKMANEWYLTGFKFALNYLLAWLPEETDLEFNKENFKDFVLEYVGDVDVNGKPVIDDNYFENLRFYEGNSNYGLHECPDPNNPTVCIPCAALRIRPVPRP